MLRHSFDEFADLRLNIVGMLISAELIPLVFLDRSLNLLIACGRQLRKIVFLLAGSLNELLELLVGAAVFGHLLEFVQDVG